MSWFICDNLIKYIRLGNLPKKKKKEEKNTFLTILEAGKLKRQLLRDSPSSVEGERAQGQEDSW